MRGSFTEEQESWRNSERLSLQSSFNRADVLSAGAWQRELENRILSSRFLWALEAGAYYKDALNAFGSHGIDRDIFSLLMEDAGNAGFS